MLQQKILNAKLLVIKFLKPITRCVKLKLKMIVILVPLIFFLS